MANVLKHSPTRRSRNAAVTRDAILASARRAFAVSGYDGAGVREIAAGAGVTAMLVNRYFGSKEQLYAEVLTATATSPTILSRENLKDQKLAEAIAKALIDMTATGNPPLDGFLILLNSASSKRAAEIGREQTENGHLKNITGALEGAFASQRAALILSVIAGFQLMRQMIGLSTLAEADAEDLVKLVTPLFRQLVDGDPSGTSAVL